MTTNTISGNVREGKAGGDTAEPLRVRRHPFFRRLGRDLLTLGMLATLSLCAGIVLNQMRDQPLPLVYASKQERVQQAVARMESDNFKPASVATDQPSSSGERPSAAVERNPLGIGLEEFQSFVTTNRGLVLDARPEIFHRLGHVPDALSVSREEFERDYASNRARLEPMREREVAVYCSGATCEDSQIVAEALVKLGYAHVLVFKGGWEEWTHAGLPEEHQ